VIRLRRGSGKWINRSIGAEWHRRRKTQFKETPQLLNRFWANTQWYCTLSETGDEITDLDEASHMTGVYEAVAPYRQLYVMQVIRYWVELLGSLQDETMKAGCEDIPHFGEIFALFYNDDSYIRTRKTWDK